MRVFVCVCMVFQGKGRLRIIWILLLGVGEARKATLNVIEFEAIDLILLCCDLLCPCVDLLLLFFPSLPRVCVFYALVVLWLERSQDLLVDKSATTLIPSSSSSLSSIIIMHKTTQRAARITDTTDRLKNTHTTHSRQSLSYRYTHISAYTTHLPSSPQHRYTLLHSPRPNAPPLPPPPPLLPPPPPPSH